MSVRKSVTDYLVTAGIGFCVKKGWATHREVGLERWGKIRADIVALNLGGKLLIIEVKSGKADFKADKKWQSYLPWCNQFYFLTTPAFASELSQCVKKTDAGVITVGSNGFARTVRRARFRQISPENTQSLITRMAWRNGISKANTKRQRVFIPEGVTDTELGIAE